MKTRKSFLIAVPCLLSVLWAAAQPANDDCANAFLIEDPINWCASEGQFTTFEASADPDHPPPCFTATGDVWFTFTAVAPSVSISVLGGFFSNQLSQPQVALYAGSCTDLTEVTCQTGSGLSLQIIETGLQLGQTYYLQVQGVAIGNFSLCLNNYSGAITATSDCPQAAVLCNQAPFVIPQVTDGGNDPSEADDAECLNIAGLPVVTFSTWFVWTAAESGSLTFALTPINETDDLDFVLYEFPNGPGDCSGKTVLRCMASSCIGPTGLNDTALDVSEAPGCSPGDDNFLAAVQMEEGVTYGLMVNNFSQTTIGFEVEFGGTASFVGGEERLAAEADEVCQDSLLTFVGLNPPGSSNVVDWQWEFGPGATPAFASGPGPHEVAFGISGTQLVLLRATTAQGCTSTEILPVEVLCCTDNFQVSATTMPPSCPGDSDGSIALDIESPNGPPFFITWEDGSSSNSRTGLATGLYSVTLSDTSECQAIRTFEVPPAQPFEIDTLLSLPSCDAGVDGSITLEVSGSAPPFSYAWEGMPFSNNNTLSNLSAGLYTVAIQDSLGCMDTLEINLQELQLMLDPQVTDSRDCLTTTDATVPERLTLTLTSDSPIILGDNARLRAITNAIEPFILWSPPDFLSCTDCATPEALQPTQSMAYQIEITDDKGCSIRDSVNLTVLLRYPAYLPNAFSPNNDGINDTWAPQGGPALERWLYLQVYDRWGGLIFEAQNPNGQNAVLDWDGRAKNQPMPVGVYTCIMEGQFIDGTVRQFQSDVLLTR